jgi:hypothetical protein
MPSLLIACDQAFRNPGKKHLKRVCCVMMYSEVCVAMARLIPCPHCGDVMEPSDIDLKLLGEDADGIWTVDSATCSACQRFILTLKRRNSRMEILSCRRIHPPEDPALPSFLKRNGVEKESLLCS